MGTFLSPNVIPGKWNLFGTRPNLEAEPAEQDPE